MRPKPYVGKTHAGDYRPFRSDVTPTEETHGDRFVIAYGPFRSAAEALVWLLGMNGNTRHVSKVKPAERRPS